MGSSSLVRRLAVAASLALAVAACGEADVEASTTSTVGTPSTTSTAGSSTTRAQVTTTIEATTTTEAVTGQSVRVFFASADQSDCSNTEAFERIIDETADPIYSAFLLLVGGPTDEEQATGAGSFFSPDTEGMVRSIAVEDGLLTVDFEDLRPVIPNASTSCGSFSLIAQLNDTAFQFEQVERVTYQIDGSCETFFNWLQRDCQVYQPEPIAVLGSFVEGTPEADALIDELDVMTRTIVAYEGYESVDELIDRVTSDDPPDVIVVPEPGVLRELAASLVDLTEFVNAGSLTQDFGAYLIDAASVDDGVLGAPINLQPKSLVWYMPDVFAAGDYAIPETFTELVALSDRIVADGGTPWCNYIESGAATGWVGTDWIEDLLLGAEGPVVYDQWVDHEVMFSDSRVESAFERYLQMIDTPGYVFERPSMTTKRFSENAEPLGEGACMMHKQATFFSPFIESAGFDLRDFSTFEFPPVSPEFEDAVVGGSNYVAAVNDRFDTQELIRFMVSKEFGENALAQSGVWIMANKSFNNDAYTDDLARSWADQTQPAVATDQFRFDGSDLMPIEVGAGIFWESVANLVDGVKSLPGVLSEIDAAWPS